MRRYQIRCAKLGGSAGHHPSVTGTLPAREALPKDRIFSL